MRTEPTVQDEFLRMPTLQRKKHGGKTHRGLSVRTNATYDKGED